MLHEQIGQYPQQGLGSKLDHTYMAYNTLKRFAEEKRKETLYFLTPNHFPSTYRTAAAEGHIATLTRPLPNSQTPPNTSEWNLFQRLCSFFVVWYLKTWIHFSEEILIWALGKNKKKKNEIWDEAMLKLFWK